MGLVGLYQAYLEPLSKIQATLFPAISPEQGARRLKNMFHGNPRNSFKKHDKVDRLKNIILIWFLKIGLVCLKGHL
jgi:hypothetical protein